MAFDAEDVAAGRFEQLHRQLTDQPKTDDDAHLAQLHVGHAHALQCDRTNRGKRGLFVGDCLGQAYREVLGHGDELGVVGQTCARARYALALDETLDVVADFEDDARAAVAERDGHVEPGADAF